MCSVLMGQGISNDESDESYAIIWTLSYDDNPDVVRPNAVRYDTGGTISISPLSLFYHHLKSYKTHAHKQEDFDIK